MLCLFVVIDYCNFLVRSTIIKDCKNKGVDMLHHRTNDPAKRAADIADREAEVVYRKTGDFDKYCKTWRGIYESTLRELCFQD